MKIRLGIALAVISVAFAAAGTLARSGPAVAQERAPAQGSDRYGSPAGDMPYDDDIRLTPNTRSVSVWRWRTVRFVTAEGREFRWRFDTLSKFGVFPLAAIAPEGVTVPAGVLVYVGRDYPDGDGGKDR